MSGLDHLRDEIDEIDERMVQLFERRMDAARRVGRYKAERDMAVSDPSRERELIEDRLSRLSDRSLRADALRLFELLISQSRQVQYGVRAGLDQKADAEFEQFLSDLKSARKPFENPRVLYQGEPGAYGEEAADIFFGGGSVKSAAVSFEEVFAGLADGRADYGVVPIENNSTGAIDEVYDLLGKYRCFIVGEQVLKIEHCLLALPGSALDDIADVYSHEQGLLQAGRFLNSYPAWNRNVLANTAVSAKFVAQSGDGTKAAIASARAADIYGLEVLARGISDNEYNNTRFAVISPALELRDGRDKVSAVFTLAHQSGSLYSVLSVFAANGLNLLKIESRPVKGKGWEYMFFVDFSGDLSLPGMDGVIRELMGASVSFRVLGNYKKAGEAL